MRTIAFVFAVLALAAVAPGAADSRPARHGPFDLEGQRGTRGQRPENTLPAFGKALQLGVTTLELDTGVTKDGVVVVSHERRISPLECQGPWVGSLIRDLTYAQIQQLDCGTRHPADPATDPFIGTQEAVRGTHMPTLAQVFELANRYGAKEGDDGRQRQGSDQPRDRNGGRRARARGLPRRDRSTTARQTGQDLDHQRRGAFLNSRDLGEAQRLLHTAVVGATPMWEWAGDDTTVFSH
jgi:hypothetical protein